MKERFAEILGKECLREESKNLKKLTEIVQKLDPKTQKFLLCTALYHDIGKAVMRPRHGPEGADIIKGSNSENRKRFYSRS